MDHRDIELLKLRKFTVSRKIPDSILYAEDIQERIVEILQPLVAFVSKLCFWRRQEEHIGLLTCTD